MQAFTSFMELLSVWLVPLIIASFIIYGMYKKIDVYKSFVTGAKEGFQTVVQIIPYIVGIFVAVAAFRESGAIDIIARVLSPVLTPFHLTPDVIPHLITRSLSGSASTAVMTELIKNYGPDSFIGRIASIFQGGSATTMYIITVYLGAVGIKKVRHTVAAGLISDFATFVLTVLVVTLTFGVN